MIYLVFVVFFSLVQGCYNGNLEFYVDCNGEHYEGLIRIELIDTNPLIFNKKLAEVEVWKKYSAISVKFPLDLSSVTNCDKIKPKWVFHSTCQKNMKFETYGVLYPIEVARRFILPDKKLMYKVELPVRSMKEIDAWDGLMIDLARNDVGLTEFL